MFIKSNINWLDIKLFFVFFLIFFIAPYYQFFFLICLINIMALPNVDKLFSFLFLHLPNGIDSLPDNVPVTWKGDTITLSGHPYNCLTFSVEEDKQDPMSIGSCFSFFPKEPTFRIIFPRDNIFSTIHPNFWLFYFSQSAKEAYPSLEKYAWNMKSVFLNFQVIFQKFLRIILAEIETMEKKIQKKKATQREATEIALSNNRLDAICSLKTCLKDVHLEKVSQRMIEKFCLLLGEIKKAFLISLKMENNHGFTEIDSSFKGNQKEAWVDWITQDKRKMMELWINIFNFTYFTKYVFSPSS